MEDQLILVLVSVVLGALVAGFAQFIERVRENRRERASITRALRVEVVSICEMLRDENQLGFVIRGIEAVQEEDGDYNHVVVFNDERVLIFRSLANRIGVLDPEIAEKFCRFYSHWFGVCEGLDPQHVQYDVEDADQELENLKFVRRHMEEALVLGDEIAQF